MAKSLNFYQISNHQIRNSSSCPDQMKKTAETLSFSFSVLSEMSARSAIQAKTGFTSFVKYAPFLKS